jgi:hypothetical protein
MPDDILNSMRGLREDMRQRLLQSAEYRALEALDAAIDKISLILQVAPVVPAPAPLASEMPMQDAGPIAAPAREVAPPSTPAIVAPQTPAARHPAIEAAFAGTLAAKLESRNGSRGTTPYQAARHT